MKHVLLVMLLVAGAPAPEAQSSRPAAGPPMNPFTSALKSRWENINKLITESAERVPESAYGFQPSPDIRTFGQIIGHLANDHYLICSGVRAEKNPSASDFEKVTSKAALTKALADSVAYCHPLYALSDAETLTEIDFFGEKGPKFSTMMLNVTHDSEHYGNLVTYMRMKGVVPPSTKPTK